MNSRGRDEGERVLAKGWEGGESCTYSVNSKRIKKKGLEKERKKEGELGELPRRKGGDLTPTSRGFKSKQKGGRTNTKLGAP